MLGAYCGIKIRNCDYIIKINILILVSIQSVTCNIHQLQPPCVTLQKYHLNIPGMFHWGILMMPTQTPDRDLIAIYTSAHSYMARATLAGSMIGDRHRT